MVFFATVTKRSKSTVDRIERVYGVYCQCISNDSLSKEELVRIKREIIRCLHHCEDLNIDAFNQYEKATRYLRKSLGDVKTLMNNYDTLSEGDKSVMYERLNADLGKALNRVHGLDIFFGLFIVLLLTSFILPHVEDSIADAGDAWWYCFALITTTGFGDITVTTTTGRILSVIIGFYGIIIVSLLTSSIVIYISDINKKEEREKRSEEEAKKLEDYDPNEGSKKSNGQMNLFAATKAKPPKKQ